MLVGMLGSLMQGQPSASLSWCGQLRGDRAFVRRPALATGFPKAPSHRGELFPSFVLLLCCPQTENNLLCGSSGGASQGNPLVSLHCVVAIVSWNRCGFCGVPQDGPCMRG